MGWAKVDPRGGSPESVTETSKSRCPLRGETQMEQDFNAIRGIIVGAMTGATLWVLIFVAAFH